MDRLSVKGQMIDQINLREVAHSGFDRSNHNYGTGKLGTLMPVRLDEVYPGDRIKGKPEQVINFEPLVAPLMGNMVLKQESFFVPYIQLWRHGYKFFTGKNGFNDPMPTISPLGIFDIYCEHVHIPLFDAEGGSEGFDYIFNQLHALYAAIANNEYEEYYSNISGHSLYVDMKSYVLVGLETVLHGTYSRRKMYDLVLPIYKRFERFVESEELVQISEELEKQYSDNTHKQERLDYIRRLSQVFGDLVKDYFNFFHGASSLFDYLGWPTPVDFSIEHLLEFDYLQITDIFGVYVYDHIVNPTPTTFYNRFKGYFSSVPLVFNPFKAYYLIWYWNYRDQLLETGILDPEEDEFLGTEITPNVVIYCTMMRQRCWYKDTFTTALTNTGDGNLIVPTSNFADEHVTVDYYDVSGTLINTTDARSAINAGATVCSYSVGGIEYRIPMNYLHGSISAVDSPSDTDVHYFSLDLFDRIKRLRSYVQKRLILGYEVDDVVYSSFLVKMSNVRLHIPEILGSGRDYVQINTIVNNTSTDQQIAGDKSATAWAHGVQSEMNYFSEEWGLFLTISTVLPIQSYAGGMQRLYLKTDPLDYMWPEFATMGMDAIYNTELASVGTHLTDEQGLQVFGYQGRYYDLKSRLDEEHGRLLTDLNYLTFSREWNKDNPPKLNYMFVHCWPRLDGFVVDDPLVDVFRYDCYNAHAWERRLPVPSEYVG